MAKKLPKVSVIERRKRNPFGASSVPITLKGGQAWAIRIINTSIKAGRYHDIVHNKGWLPVQADELDGRPEELGFRVMDDRLVRGEHGEEILMKMPQADFDAIQMAKADHNIKGLGQKRAVEDAANRAAAQFGDQAGDAVYGSQMTVNDSRVAMDLEGDGPS